MKTYEELQAENAALVALLDKIKFITPEMLRAAQVRSELGAYACSELSGAYSLIAEIYTVMVGEFMKQTTPLQCLREIEANAGRAGFVAGAEMWSDYGVKSRYKDDYLVDIEADARKYAEKVRNSE